MGLDKYKWKNRIEIMKDKEEWRDLDDVDVLGPVTQQGLFVWENLFSRAGN